MAQDAREDLMAELAELEREVDAIDSDLMLNQKRRGELHDDAVAMRKDRDRHTERIAAIKQVATLSDGEIAALAQVVKDAGGVKPTSAAGTPGGTRTKK